MPDTPIEVTAMIMLLVGRIVLFVLAATTTVNAFALVIMAIQEQGRSVTGLWKPWLCWGLFAAAMGWFT